VFQIWSMMWGKLDPINQMAIHLVFILGLTFLVYGYSKGTKSLTNHVPKWIDYLFVLLAFGAGIYFTVHAERIASRIPIMEPLTALDIFFGLILVILTIEATRRTIGIPIVLRVASIVKITKIRPKKMSKAVNGSIIGILLAIRSA
ncbi:hypothetical protein, partial [Pseudomonas cedrina]|uniref:hypothetical protein n=1 Tax=Pseudomonas cedrina TaxID=651740 RepID=UPI00373FCF6C